MRRTVMSYRCSAGSFGLAAALCLTVVGISVSSSVSSWAFDETKYPDWKGQWSRAPVPGLRGQPAFDPNKPDGLGQQAPLTPEYQALLEASVADQAAGGAGLDR